MAQREGEVDVRSDGAGPMIGHRITALVHAVDDGLLLRVATLLHRRHVVVTELTWHMRPNLAEEGELAGDLTVVFTASRQQARVVLAGFVHMVGVVRPSLRDESSH